MSEIMSYRQWMQGTDGGITSVRSKELKAVDAALLDYHRSKKTHPDWERLRTALLAWMKLKGPAWKTSVRNKRRAVEDLYQQVMGFPGTTASEREMSALWELQKEQKALLDKLFLNRKLTWREPKQWYESRLKLWLAYNKFGTAGNTASAAKNIYTLAKAGGAGGGGIGEGKAMKLAEELIGHVPPNIRGEVLQGLSLVLPDFTKQLAASLTPFVGVLISGGTTAYNLTKSVMGLYRIDSFNTHVQDSLSVGEPREAMYAIARFLDREFHADTYSTVVSFWEFAGKLAGTLADGGTATNAAIGLASNVAKLLFILRVVWRDVEEKNAANALLQKPVTIEIFERNTLIGAYYVCCVPTSVLVNEVLERFGQRGWMGDVERALTLHIEPIREQARRVIREHRFEIKELRNYPGVLMPSTDKLEDMQKARGKYTGFGSHNLPPALVSAGPRQEFLVD